MFEDACMHAAASRPLNSLQDVQRQTQQGVCVQVNIHLAGQVQWRLEYRHVTSPVARLLLPQAGTRTSPFALFGKVGNSPRVYTTQSRDAVLKSLQSAAYNKMGLTVAGLTVKS